MAFSSFQNALERDVALGEIAGAVTLVAHGPNISLASVGSLGPSQGTPMMDDAIFWIASMSKPIASAAALLLIEEGRLGLLDPVSKFIPKFDSLCVQDGAKAHSPTVLDLLRHTSGLTYPFCGESPIHKAYDMAGVWDFNKTNAEIMQMLAVFPLLYQPGSTFEYGMSTDVLGYVIEQCAGQPLDCFLADRFFGPLKMASTGFQVQAKDQYKVARPLNTENFQLAPPVDGGRWLSAGAGLWSSAPDYFRFVRMLMNGGELDGVRVLKEQTVASMRVDQLPHDVKYGSSVDLLGIVAPTPAHGQGFGLGLCVRTQPANDVPSSVGDFAWPGISGTSFWADPVHDLIVISMIQAPSKRHIYRKLARQSIYADLVIKK